MYRLLLVLLCLCSSCFSANCAITNSTKCGRLGDQLVELAEACWLAEKYHLPLYLTPFTHSDEFSFSDHLSLPPKNKKKESISRINYENIRDDKNLLYVVHLAAGVPTTKEYMKTYNVLWKDPNFLKKIRSLFSLKKEVNTVSIPKQMISIALHLRTGYGADGERAKSQLSRKFSSLPFAMKCIESLYSYFDKAPLYIHLFSDEKNPGNLLKKIQKEITYDNILWGVSDNANPKERIFEDLFSMAKFDALITSSSNFSFISWVLGDLEVTIRQTKAHYLKGEIIVDDYEVVGKNNETIPIRI